MANWEGVSEFVAVAETQSFTSAAKKLDTSVAQISRKVALLEERLAVKLFNRTTRRVSVTEAGQLYYQQCKHLVEGLELAELAVTQMQSTPKGLLKVTAPVTFGEQNLAPLLHQFLERYPQVDLELMLTNQKLDLIEVGVDVAIRLGKLQDSSLIAKRLSSRQLYVCASPSYLERYGEPHTLSELNHHQCLVGSVDYWRFRDSKSEKSIRVSGRIHCNSGYALLDAAKRGLGLVHLPDHYVKEALEAGELVEVLSEYRDEREGIWALYPQNRNLSPKVRLLIDFLAENFD
ncbi:LysR substrate-binding domain-containing protein [Vibrio tubiashii]|uniref:Transcriptional regulator n=1 Tax=Vibrio tubiashii ATCC 19109 TaxID=1051646 RepID=F9TA69_9VIBR|nr:LysR substrate-binding domain-containing protein [Vibrio tubiashii]AIW16113.1 LysR family transcriptional regulator [Vibrio tubiashii ATCC 19109]EGU50340.1 transcriptional regulator [Vibrio tubiashii ATCC 19109]EIF03550.1 transcriptional regulator [Vibrio tubiashii NCIMB 1337 = ATCC 19106]